MYWASEAADGEIMELGYRDLEVACMNERIGENLMMHHDGELSCHLCCHGSEAAH